MIKGYIKAVAPAYLAAAAVAGILVYGVNRIEADMPKVHFVLLHNTPTGQTETLKLGPMPEAACLPMMRAVWAEPWPNVVYPAGVQVLDEAGKPEEIPVTDAACLPIKEP